MRNRKYPSEVLSYVLAGALDEMEETLSAFDMALVRHPDGHEKASRAEKIGHIRVLCAAMAEMPAILLVQAHGAGDWMAEEIRSRMTPEVAESVDVCMRLYLEARGNKKLAPLGVIICIAKNLI